MFFGKSPPNHCPAGICPAGEAVPGKSIMTPVDKGVEINHSCQFQCSLHDLSYPCDGST